MAAGASCEASFIMSAAEQLLARLDGLQGHGGRWRARCPAHDSQGRSLSVADREGTLLINCFGGCDVGSVLAAVGLEFRDLYDKPLDQERKSTRKEWHLRQAIAAIAHEAKVVVIAARDVAAGLRLSDVDVSRLAVAAGRIAAAHRRLYGA